MHHFHPSSPTQKKKINVTLDKRPKFRREKIRCLPRGQYKIKTTPDKRPSFGTTNSNKSPVRQDSTKPKLSSSKGKFLKIKKVKIHEYGLKSPSAKTPRIRSLSTMQNKIQWCPPVTKI